jgi:hypothetical protein
MVILISGLGWNDRLQYFRVAYRERAGNSMGSEPQMRKPSAFVVQVLSSYGGTFAAVCGSINVWTEAAAG